MSQIRLMRDLKRRMKKNKRFIQRTLSIKMRTEKQLIKKWKAEGNKWGKMSQKHANSKESKIKGHVTKDEHITGEKLSFVEGWIYALEWVINNDKLLEEESD